jgi:hypothetical protein
MRAVFSAIPSTSSLRKYLHLHEYFRASPADHYAAEMARTRVTATRLSPPLIMLVVSDTRIYLQCLVLLTGRLCADIYISNGKNTRFIYKSCAAYVFNGSGVDFTYCGSDAGAVTCECWLRFMLC